MSKIIVSTFLLAIVKLQEFCYKYGFVDYRILGDMLIDSCKIDGRDRKDKNLIPEIAELRNSEPFVSLDLSQESYIYSVFRQLDD